MLQIVRNHRRQRQYTTPLVAKEKRQRQNLEEDAFILFLKHSAISAGLVPKMQTS